MTVSTLQTLKVLLHQTVTATSATHALDSTPASGSLIVFGGFIDKATTPSDSSGTFTVHVAQSNTSLSYFLFSKVSNGTELNLVVNFGDATSNMCKTFSYVLSADAAMDVLSSFYSTSAVRSITANTTAALGSDTWKAIAAIGADSVGGISAGSAHTIDNDYSLITQNYTDSSPGGIPALAIAEKTSLFDTAGEFATFQYTGGTTDEMGIMLFVIRDTNPGASSGKPAYYYAQM